MQTKFFIVKNRNCVKLDPCKLLHYNCTHNKSVVKYSYRFKLRIRIQTICPPPEAINLNAADDGYTENISFDFLIKINCTLLTYRILYR